jgi:hypothetical protein
MACSSPHFSPAFYCGGGSGHVNCVALCRAPRHTVEYACGALGSLHIYTWREAPSTMPVCAASLRNLVRNGACPSNRRGRAHGACTASSRREEEAMSMHIVDDEQRRDRRVTPMRPSGSSLARTSAALALLDDVHRQYVEEPEEAQRC